MPKQHIWRIDKLERGYRESEACHMLLEAELFDCRERCAELFRVAHTLDHAEMRERDAIAADYGIAGFFERLVVLRQRLDIKGNRGPRAKDAERRQAVVLDFKQARDQVSYDEALDAVAERHRMSRKRIEAIVAEVRSRVRVRYDDEMKQGRGHEGALAHAGFDDGISAAGVLWLIDHDAWARKYHRRR
jgi:hypothetical protein